MNILAIDQARHGGWSVFDYQQKELISSGVFDFDGKKYPFEKAMVLIVSLVEELIEAYDVGAVFIEDIQLQRNVQSFKQLARLQGALIALFEQHEYLYGVIPPSAWQTYCMARGRTQKEVKAKVRSVEKDSRKKATKVLSIQYVKEHDGIETENDNLADAICIGHYVVNHIKICKVEET